MGKQIEYEVLREEILCSTQVVKNYRSLLYSIVVAALAFAFDKNEAILFLVPFIAIIPIYLLAMHQIDSTWKDKKLPQFSKKFLFCMFEYKKEGEMIITVKGILSTIALLLLGAIIFIYLLL